VTLWEDIGPSGRNFASGVTPDHNTANNIVNFNGSNDYLIGGSGLLPATGDFTLVLRFGFTGGRNNTLISSFDSSTGTPSAGVWALDVVTSNTLRFYDNPAGGKPQLMFTTGVAISTTGLRTVTLTRSGHTFVLRVDGTQINQHTDTGALRTTYSATVRLGTRHSQNYLLGGIVRVGCWGQAFTGGDLTTIEDWASNGG